MSRSIGKKRQESLEVLRLGISPTRFDLRPRFGLKFR